MSLLPSRATSSILTMFRLLRFSASTACIRLTRCAMTCVIFLCLPWLLDAPVHAQPLGAETTMDDLEQTIECRRLLLDDPVLGPLNLGVRVKNRVATLWGPVPSRAVARRAEQCLRTMIELVEVKNQMHVAPDADWGVPNNPPNLPNVLPDRLPPPLPAPMRPLLPRLEEPEAADIARLLFIR